MDLLLVPQGTSYFCNLVNIMTDFPNFAQLLPVDHSVNGKLTVFVEENSAPQRMMIAVASSGESSIDAQAIAQDFLGYYATFIDGTQDNWLAWQSPTFGIDKVTVSGSGVWVKAGVAGVAGLAAITTASVLLPKTIVQAITQLPQKFLSHSAKPPSVPVSVQKSQSVTAIAPPESLSEGSRLIPNTAGVLPKLTIRRVISPAMRSPLPVGQLISQQQTTSLTQPEAPLTIALPLERRLPERGMVKGVEPTRQPPPIHPAPEATTPTLSPLSEPNPLHRPQTPRGLLVDSVNRSANASPQILTPLPANAHKASGTSPQPPDAALPMPVNAAPTATLSTSPVVPERMATMIGQQFSEAIKHQTVLSVSPSPPLAQAISAARTMPDFLQIAPQIPEQAQLAVLALTSQAALAVPKGDKLQQFQIFRLPVTIYQKAWIASTQTEKELPAVPMYGFIDYQKQAIVLPSP